LSNYTKATNFASKDALLTGNPSKIVKGTELDNEFNAISTAVSTKFDTTALAAPGPIGATTPAAISGTTINGTTGTFSGNVQMASLNGGAIALRNSIINGDMRVAQRGTTGALTTGYTYISVDRFAGIQGTTANGILARVTAALDGFQFAAKIGRNAAATTTGPIVLRSALESVNSIPLQGKEVTFSFYAKAGANFSAASSNISVTVSTGTGTDQSLATMATWTGVATPITGTTAITTSWVRYSYTGTIAASATQVGVSISHTPVGTAGADDSLYVTGVQLEVGPVATPFEQRPIGMELALCQRYFEVSANMLPAWAQSTTAGKISGIFQVPKRTGPSVALYTGATINAQGPTGTFASGLNSTFGTTTITTFNYPTGSGYGYGVDYTNATALTQGIGYIYIFNTQAIGAPIFSFSAEL